MSPVKRAIPRKDNACTTLTICELAPKSGEFAIRSTSAESAASVFRASATSRKEIEFLASKLITLAATGGKGGRLLTAAMARESFMYGVPDTLIGSGSRTTRRESQRFAGLDHRPALCLAV